MGIIWARDQASTYSHPNSGDICLGMASKHSWRVCRGCPLLSGVGTGDRMTEESRSQDIVLLLFLPLLFSGALGATLITISFVFPFFLLFAFLPFTPHPDPLHFPSPSPHSHQQLASPPYPPFPSDYLALQLPEPSPLRPKREKRPRLPRKLKVPCFGDVREGPHRQDSHLREAQDGLGIQFLFGTAESPAQG